MSDGPVLVFVEVRYRRHPGYGGGAASVDRSKQRRIASTARHYLSAHAGQAPPPCRFDVVSIDATDRAGLRWIRSAFELS
jgi:putative endonuclease